MDKFNSLALYKLCKQHDAQIEVETQQIYLYQKQAQNPRSEYRSAVDDETWMAVQSMRRIWTRESRYLTTIQDSVGSRTAKKKDTRQPIRNSRFL